MTTYTVYRVFRTCGSESGSGSGSGKIGETYGWFPL